MRPCYNIVIEKVHLFNTHIRNIEEKNNREPRGIVPPGKAGKPFWAKKQKNPAGARI
jgi:hypothetical protein